MIQLTQEELESIIKRTAEATAEAVLAKKSRKHSAAIKAGLAKSGRAAPPPQDIEKHAAYYVEKVKEHKDHTGEYPTLRTMRRYLEHRLPQEAQREQVRKYCFENHWIRWVPQSSLDAAKGRPQRVMPVE